MAGLARISFQLACQISPIILTSGAAGSIPGGMLPIISLSQSPNFDGLLGGGDLDNLDDYILQFKPLPGATLIAQRVGTYPFANQQVAANAVVRDPLVISFRMDVNANVRGGGYLTKAAMITALQATLQGHNNSGGMYTLVTPSYVYTNCIMLDMRDISRNDNKMAQNAWQLDFVQPLVTLAQAAQAQGQLNSTMSQINAGIPTQGDQSGLPPTLGAPNTLATPSIAPAASDLLGTNTASIGAINSGVAGSAFAAQFGPGN